MMNLFKKTQYFVTVALMGLVSSLFAPILMSGAYAADKIILDPDVKNVSVAGSGYSDTSVSNVALGDTVRFRIKVNNVSGSNIDKVTVRANLNKVSGETKHWTMDAQAETTVGNQTTSMSSPVSVFMQNDNNLDYVTGSTKISVNGAEPQDVPDIAGTSPLLRSGGYILNNYPTMTIDPQTWLFLDAKVIAGIPVTPQINIQFNKEFMNVTKGTAWSKTVTADPGDVIKARIWFHNGGVTGASDKPATGVVITDSMPFTSATSFVNSATFTSTEVGPLVSQATLNLTSAQSLSYVLGSTNLVVPTSNSNDINVLFDTGNRVNIADVGTSSALMSSAGYQFGTLQFCWQYQRFVEFQVKVGQPTVTPTPTPVVTTIVVTPTPGQVQAVTTTTLPKTGPEDLALVGLIGSAISGLYLRKFSTVFNQA